VPLFAGIYKKGAGLGPAITFLFFAPAANILALVYTGGVIGVDLALARLFLSLAFGIGIGMIMALIFRKEDAAHDKATDALFAGQNARACARCAAFLLILASAAVGRHAQDRDLHQLLYPGWYSTSGVSTFRGSLTGWCRMIVRGQGVGTGLVLILLLAGIGLAAWKGFENIHEGFNRWTWVALGLVSLTLLVASSPFVEAAGLSVAVTGKID
jgi:uncharacterized membrane protein YraQ (UPF0718 family)